MKNLNVTESGLITQGRALSCVSHKLASFLCPADVKRRVKKQNKTATLFLFYLAELDAADVSSGIMVETVYGGETGAPALCV